MYSHIVCLTTGSLSKLREISFASKLWFDATLLGGFWLYCVWNQSCLRHFHTSAEKNNPLAILSHNSYQSLQH